MEMESASTSRASTGQRVRITSKSASPELTVLVGAASELASMDELKLLPAAFLDRNNSTATMTTAAPNSPSAEDSDQDSAPQSKSDESVPPASCGEVSSEAEPDRLEEGEEECEEAPGAIEEDAAAPECGDDDWDEEAYQEQEWNEWDEWTSEWENVVAASWMEGVPQTSDAASGFVQMWCRMQCIGDQQYLVMPFADGCLDTPPELPFASAEETVFKAWCWVQPDGEGALTVVPCAAQAPPVQDSAEAPEGAREAPGSEAQDEAEAVAQAHETGDEAEHAEDTPKTEEAAETCPEEAEGKSTFFSPPWACGPFWSIDEPPTTLSLSGLPSGFTQEDLLEVLDRQEFSGLYDFVFMPEPSEGVSRFALVNTTKHTYALTLAAQLHGRTLPGAEETCKVMWTLDMQGKDRLLAAFEEVQGGQQPQLFDQGYPVPLPTPVREDGEGAGGETQ